jgi:hypothetical protein
MPIPDRRAGPAGLPILRQAESGWKVVLPRTREDHLRQACPAGVGTRVGAVAVTTPRGREMPTELLRSRFGPSPRLRRSGLAPISARWCSSSPALPVQCFRRLAITASRDGSAAGGVAPGVGGVAPGSAEAAQPGRSRRVSWRRRTARDRPATARQARRPPKLATIGGGALFAGVVIGGVLGVGRRLVPPDQKSRSIGPRGPGIAGIPGRPRRR